ncbi:MAG: DUF2169 domain-containing protein [Polyangiaceae bacterium]|nr:DUF2169 domain-containing protein [Polyangiaceae bacterium]
MIVKNLTPFAFATKVVSRKPPRPEMMLVVKAVFELRPDAPLTPLDRADSVPTGDVMTEDDDDRIGECLLPNDFADFKTNAEVLVKATFHAPRKRPVREAECAVSVGRWRKVLRVVGPRVWVDDALGSQPTEPVPFTELPIRWANAYGGVGFPTNPVGKGHSTKELPQIELPNAPVRSRAASNVAASFGPINRRWPQRATMVGTRYGKDWEATRAPFGSEDFQWAYHQAAPSDQWLDGYLRGDETITFDNLHPDSSSFSVTLPRLRVRAFGRSRSGASRVLPMVLDTVVADVEKGRLALVWRGHMPSADLDLRDVRSLLIASETLGSARLEQEYFAMLDAFEADPIGLEAARAEMMAEMMEGIPAPPASAPASPNDPVSKAVAAKVDGADILKQHIAAGMASVVAAQTGGTEAMAELEKSIAVASASDDDEPPVPVTSKPGALPSTGLRRRVRGIMADIERARANLAGKPIPEEQQRELERLLKLPHDPTLPQLDPEYSVPEPLTTDQPGPGANLIDHDLTGRDLSGLDLSGARLDGAVLTRANLTGTKLRGASLRGAVLFKADATGADFEGADLTRANLAKLVARRASFRRANLELAFLEDAVLAEAILEEARFEWTAVARADLSRARAKNVRMYRADLAEATLKGADFSGGSLRASVLSRCDAEGVDWSGTEIRAVSAEGIRLKGARLVRAHGERAFFAEANLDEADLSLAVLPHCHLVDAQIRSAELYGADLRYGRLDRADLSSSRVDMANLFSADLRAVTVDRTKFTGSNLYDAKLIGAAGEGVDFSGANLERCVYTKRSVEAGT